MRATTVRFSDDLWGMLEAEAGREGVSAAQFVRDATVMRIAFTMGRRGDPGLESALGRIAHTEGGSDLGDEARAAIATALETARDPDRLKALRRTDLLDTPADDAFDRPARLAARALRAPVALVSLIDEDRQFFKSCLGLPEPWLSRRETPLSHSFCQHAVAARKPLNVPDARKHPVLKFNAAIKDLNVIAYLGMPLIDDAGHALGTLCVIDSKPRNWTADDEAVLMDLAELVISQIALSRRAGDLPTPPPSYLGAARGSSER
jgi:GAF domain-containing protein